MENSMVAAATALLTLVQSGAVTRKVALITVDLLRTAGYNRMADELLNAGGDRARAAILSKAIDAMADDIETYCEWSDVGHAAGEASGARAQTQTELVTVPDETPAEPRGVHLTCRTKAEWIRALGKHGWIIWRTLCETIPCSPVRARAGNLEIRNHAAKAHGSHDGQCVHRIAVNLATGEVVDGGFVLTGECAINERAERVAPMVLTSLPANVASGWFKYHYGRATLELEVPDSMLPPLLGA